MKQLLTAAHASYQPNRVVLGTAGPVDPFAAGLPERERLVIALYYDEDLNLREIGQVLGVSESRVCQIHSQAALRLRSRLTEWLPAAEAEF